MIECLYKDRSPDVLGEITKYLNIGDIHAFSCTCKALKEKLNTEYILKLIRSFPYVASLYGRVDDITKGVTFKYLGFKKPFVPQLLSINQLSFLEQCELCDTIRSYKEGVPKDIENQLNSKELLSIENIPKLRAYTKARDTIIVWCTITQAAGLQTPFLPDAAFWSKSENVLEAVKGYEKWCEDNKTQLANITWLNLSRNKLTQTPDLSMLSALRDLHLSENRLTETPDLSMLPKLKWLFLSDNLLTQTPDLSMLSELRYLFLYRNLLTKTPDLRHNIHLGNLNLSQNKFTQTPDLSMLLELEQLNLSQNQLTQTPDLSMLLKLKQLNLSQNQLTQTPDLSMLTKLSVVDLSHNSFPSSSGNTIAKWIVVSGVGLGIVMGAAYLGPNAFWGVVSSMQGIAWQFFKNKAFQ